MPAYPPQPPTTTTTEPVLTIDELAAWWKVHPTTVRKWIACGILPVIRLSPRVTRISLSVASDFDAMQVRWTATSDHSDHE